MEKKLYKEGHNILYGFLNISGNLKWFFEQWFLRYKKNNFSFICE